MHIVLLCITMYWTRSKALFCYFCHLLCCSVNFLISCKIANLHETYKGVTSLQFSEIFFFFLGGGGGRERKEIFMAYAKISQLWKIQGVGLG